MVELFDFILTMLIVTTGAVVGVALLAGAVWCIEKLTGVGGD